MLELLAHHIIPAAYAVLPSRMQSPEATAMLLAIALQESRCVYRRQVKGPARGFWQFELAGVAGVRRHPASQQHLKVALACLCYPRTLAIADAHAALEHNDVLACVCARLLLWTLPSELPAKDEPDRGWDQYFAAWRPGRPHPDTWHEQYVRAWELV